ncbi:organic solute transporter alpha-like protein [Anticarsia gemmatalis]|uniref:organic solute transporter alpha-like protein n=1 Tax=Anticarsia gemmatalis TaxID=129554 RepID=UPI003F771DF0
MDLLSEASSGSRVLIARHISADKSPPETNNAINSTMLCHSYSNHPDFASYYAALNPYAWILWGCGLVVLISILTLYFITLRAAMRHYRGYINHVAVVLSVYPIVAAGAFIAIIVPRFRIPAEAISQQTVTIALYHFFCLVIAECGGVEQLIRSTGGAELETRTLPCCCWPCCIIPRPKIRKKSLAGLHYLVLQMPIIQAIIYVLILTLWVEDFNLYNRNFIYFQPFVAGSILPGMWGVVMCVRMALTVGHNPKPRFFAIQLVLIIVKVQVGMAKALAEVINAPCLVKIHPVVFGSMVQNCVMMVEMLLISLWAWRLYRNPPGKDLNNEPKEKSNSTLDDNIRSIEVRSIKEGIDNKTFNNNVEVDD